MKSRLQGSPGSGFAASAVKSRWGLPAILAVLGAWTSLWAATPVTGVTNFDALTTQTVLADTSAGAPGATAPDIAGWDFLVISAGSALANVDIWDGNVSSGNGVAISRHNYAVADFTVVKVAANDQSTFDLRSVGLNVEIAQSGAVVPGHSVTLTGLNAAGNPIAGATLTSTVNDAALVTFDVSSNASFNGISAFGVSPVTAGDRISRIFIDNIHAINFAAIDNVAPNPPSTPQLSAGSDSGTSGSDNLTNISSPTFTGTAEAGATVRLYDTNGTTVIGSGTATGGTWSITSSTLSQGNHTVTAKAIDAAGNVSAASAGLTITIDTVAASVNSVAIPANGNYGEGEHLDFTVNYSKSITVTTSGGVPYISLNLDTGGAARANFLFGSGTSSLTFRYTVVNGAFDTNGITVAPNIVLGGGTLRDTAGNNALLPLTGIASTSGIRVDATPPTVSSINRIQTSLTNLASVSYTVTFSKPVTGVDVSDFTLTTTGTVSALNINVSPVTTSTYTVTISSLAGAGTLRLDLRSSGTGIADLAGNGITSGYTAGQPYTIDRVAPVVTAVGLPADRTYLATQALAFTVTFSETVTVVTSGGTPRLPVTLDIGGGVNATYLSGSGTTTLTFRYTVVAGNADTDGVGIAPAVQANGGTIRDAVGNDANLALNNVPSTAGVLVDAIVPTVTGVTLPANGSYTAGQTLDFVVTFSDLVTVNATGGIPYIGLTLDTGGAVRANLASGSGTASLLFRYTVATGNADPTGIAMLGSISLNSATIRDGSGNNAALNFTGVGATTGIHVDAIAPSVTSINRQTPTTLSTNAESVTFRVTFNEIVSGVDASDFSLTTTGLVTGSIASVNPLSGLIYEVVVNSISGTGTLRLDLNASGTAIADAAGNPIAAGALGTQSYTIDTIAPAVVSVAVPAAGIFKLGDYLDFTVTFSEIVATTGNPRLQLVLDTGGTVNANYFSGTGTNKLTFRHTVAAGVLDLDGIAVVPTLDLSAGTVRDPAGNGTVSALNAVSDPSGVLVDGIVPAVVSVTVPADGTYKLGSTLDFEVHLSEAVVVTGAPRLNVTLDSGGTLNAPFLSGSGTDTLTFRYVVAAGNADKTGVALGSAIVPSGGTLRDAAGNGAALTLNNIGATAAVLVDGIPPTLSSITRSGSAVTSAASLAYTVTFSESVSGVTTGSFTLTTTGTASATIASVTATTPSIYTVTLQPVSGDGTLRLDLPASGSGVADLAGNAIASAFAGAEIYTVDHTAPAITSVSVPAARIYAAGQTLDFTVHLSEAAIVNTAGSAPFLALNLDTGGTVQAGYVSGSGTSALLFRYTVAGGNVDADGIDLATSLTASGGTLRDAASNDLLPTLNGAASTAGVLIDAVAPTVIAVTAPADGTYIKDSVLEFAIDYSEPVNVQGAPKLAISLATGGPAEAVYSAGSGSSTLVFQYAVGDGQQDTDGITVTPAVVLQGGTIRDDAGNNAALATPAFETSAVLVDGLAPVVVSITRFQPTHATTSQPSVKFRVSFNKDVTGVDGTVFALTTTGAADGTIGAVTPVSDRLYEVSVGSLVLDGTLRLDLAAASGISDSAGNVLNTAFAGGETFTLVDNLPPSFTPGEDLTLGRDAGPQTIEQWATDIDAGAPAESGQSLSFIVTVDTPSLFTTPPAIDADGTLTFTPNPTASGIATVTVILRDDSDANNESAPATFAIHLTSYDGQLGIYNGLVQAAPGQDASHSASGVLRVVVGKKGAFTANLKLAASSFTLRGSFNNSGEATFGAKAETSAILKRRDLPPLELTMLLDVAGGTDTLSATLTEEGRDFAVAEADRALYTAAKAPVAPFLNVPADLLGRYTVVLAAKTPAEQGIGASYFPQGDGIGILTVSSKGVARLTGTLSDGTAISYSNSLSKANVLPFYVSLLAGRGSISAPIVFRETPSVSDLDGLDAHWFRPEQPSAKRYPLGWTDGIRVDVLGAKFSIPATTDNASIFTGLAVPDAGGNATASFTGGNIAPPGLTIPVSISAKNVVTVPDFGGPKLSLKLLFPAGRLEGPNQRRGLVANGMFNGSFVHPMNNARASFKGVIFQKQQSAFGFFTGPTECGAVTLAPR